MSSERNKEARGILQILLRFHRMITTVGFVILPVETAIGIAVGFYSPLYGVGVLGLLLLLTWVYFDVRKHQRNRKARIVNGGR